MQMLCRLLDQVMLRGLWLGAVFCWFGVPAWAAIPASPAMALQKSVLDWVVQTQSVPAESVVLAPLDPRLSRPQTTGPRAAPTRRATTKAAQ